MGGGKPSPFLTMEKIEIYKKVRETYDVILFMDHTVWLFPNKSRVKVSTAVPHRSDRARRTGSVEKGGSGPVRKSAAF